MKPMPKLLRGLVAKASRGTLSGYVINAPKQYGQPITTTKGDAYGLISPIRMREIVMKTPTAAACVNAILDFAVGVEIKCKNIDPAIKADPTRVRHVMQLLKRPNKQQTGRRFTRALMRDLLTFGYAGVEMEANRAGGVANLYVLDGQRLKIDFDEHGTLTGIDMLDARGVPIKGRDGIHGWMPDQVIWFVLDEESDSLYGTSRIVQLYALGVLEALMLAYIGGRFTDTNIPYGVMDLGDISQEELEFAIDKWNEQAENRGQHRIIMTGSKGGAKFFDFGAALKDLDAANLLMSIRSMIMGILGCTLNELGESQDVNKSNGYNLSYTFKKRAVEPILDEITDTLTQFLVHDRLGYTDIELDYAEIDSRDELLQAQIDEVYLKVGISSINNVRNRKQMPSTKGGDEPTIFTGSAYIPVSMINTFAQAQLALLVLEAQTMQVALTQPQEGQQSSGMEPPLIRPMQSPEKWTTIDGQGSATAKLKLPKPKVGPKKENPQGSRGPVQTARNAAGVRKEAM
jgi:hypothetical protein